MTTPHLFPFVRHAYRTPLTIDSAEGCRIRSTDGKEYIDAYAGVASVSVGHCNPRVTARVREQAGRVHHTTMLYRTELLTSYLQQLQDVLPDRLCRHFFVNSGSEAVDFACQTARAHRRKPVILAMSEGFHGGSFLTKSLTGLDAWRPAFGGIDDVLFHPVSSCRNCPDSGCSAGCRHLEPLSVDCAARCLDELEDTLRIHGDRIAAVLVEPVLGVGGILTPPRPFFRRLRTLCDAFEADLIADEVQTGFGRCGTTLFASDLLDLQPDLVCMAKGIANGYPLGLVSATEDAADALKEFLHFSTFGGNPVSLAAADETLRIIVEEQLPGHVARIGARLLEGLVSSLSETPSVQEIRGIGLMIGIELADTLPAATVMERCYERGLLVGIGG
ncbi:MAG TPA: aspartate aminotransferase family protein, partial [Candidatus Ozemobacteraceae bacterium]